MSIRSKVLALADVDVTDVVTKVKFPPLSVDTAELPASFVMLPTSDYEPISTCTDTDDTVALDFVVAIEPLGQDIQPENYDKVLTFADNVNDALKTNRSTLGSFVEWTIATTAGIDIAGLAYWGVIASVTMRG